MAKLVGPALVVIGEILRTHGLKGEVRVAPLTDDPDRFTRVTACVLWDRARDEREPRRIRATRPQGEGVVVTFERCESVEAAAGLVGRLIAVPASEALPAGPGRFYPWQLEGCRVEREDGSLVGHVSGIERSPAHDLWVVRDGPREHLVPAVGEIVRDVDLAGRRVVIRPPEGLLDL